MSKTREALEAALRDAMKKAFNFGQTYWQQADSHFVSQQNKSDITREAFNKLVNDIVRSVLAEPEQEPEHVAVYEESFYRDYGVLHSCGIKVHLLKEIPVGTKLYTGPTPRHALTDQELEDALPTNDSMSRKDALRWMARWTERFHGIGE